METRLVHEVYAAAQEYGEFLYRGDPITFDVPSEPGMVISGLALGDSVLVRRTDFGENCGIVNVSYGKRRVGVPYIPGRTVVLPWSW